MSVGIRLGATGLICRPLRWLRNSNATRHTEPLWVVVERPAKRAAGDFELWRPEQIRPGHLEARAIEADQASECASNGRTASRSFYAHAVIVRRLRCPRKT